MLAHPPCASISHWLGSFQIFGYFLAFFEKLPNQCEMLAQGVCASISHWLGKTGSFRNYTLIGQDFKTAQSMWKNFKNISAILKLPNQCMETTQSMWNACSKHFTLIGIYSPTIRDSQTFPINHIDWVEYFKNFSAISKQPNQCMYTYHISIIVGKH